MGLVNRRSNPRYTVGRYPTPITVEFGRREGNNLLTDGIRDDIALGDPSQGWWARTDFTSLEAKGCLMRLLGSTYVTCN
jgi:hypothetical protein